MWIILSIVAVVMAWVNRNLKSELNRTHQQLVVLISLVVAPLFEELVFRYALRNLFPGEYTWIWVNLLFALMHIQNYLVVTHPNILVHQICLFMIGVQLWQYELPNAILIHYAWDIAMVALYYLVRYVNKATNTKIEQPSTFDLETPPVKRKHFMSNRRRSMGNLIEFRSISDGRFISVSQPDWIAKMDQRLREHERKRAGLQPISNLLLQ